ncbi:MAG TPA: hypothetical protein VKF32_00585 [Thermoanaerobaculia bacterium]|nr:hypothetical protein [Thermoanaerobaculia bacterium]
MRARLAAIAAAVLVAAVAFSNLDLLSGRTTPFFRDLGTTQRPARAEYARIGAARLLPAASFGEPYAGNPNFLLAYPFPKSPRGLGVHLLLHLGIALAGAYALFRRLVVAPEAALVGALAFGLSGYVVSSTAFLNAATTIAWIPWLLAAVVAARGATGARRLLAIGSVAAATALLLLAGEPALAALAVALALVLALSGPRGTRLPALLALAAGGVLGALLVSPWLLEVVRASAFSTRRARGFSWAEFAAVGFHPARLLETPFPGVFGDPTRLVAGGFWGFAFTQGNGPYLVSLHLGVLPLALALLFALSARRGEARVFLAAGALAFLLSLAPWIPGARTVYEHLKPLHVLRYPVKAFLVATLAVAALAAYGADRLLLSESLPAFRRRAAWALTLAAASLALVALLFHLEPRATEGFLARAWDPAWRSDPHVVLAPIARRLPIQAAGSAALLLVLAILLRRGAADARGRALLLAAVAAELLLACRTLLPRVPAEWYDTPSPLVSRAAALGGRVFERTGKDLDAVRRGLFGRVPADDLRAVALAQARQGWALTGAPHGLRYAYDQDPDGSYTPLNRIAADVVVSRDWPRRLKWLRAAGVAGVIAHDVPEGLPGLTPVAREDRIGIPTTLYRVEGALPGVRRLSRAIGATTMNEVVATFEGAAFDPGTDGVVPGAAPAGLSDASVDPTATARVLRDAPDALAIATSGASPGLLHVDRSFTPRVEARVNGASVRVLALDIHLIGVPVPAGRARVDISLAP